MPQLPRTTFSCRIGKSPIDTQLSAFARLTFLVCWIAVSALVVSSLGVFAVTWIGSRNHRRDWYSPSNWSNADRHSHAILLRSELSAPWSAVAAESRLLTPLCVSSTHWSNSRSCFRRPLPPSETVASIMLYSGFALLSSLRAVGIQPLVALRTE